MKRVASLSSLPAIVLLPKRSKRAVSDDVLASIKTNVEEEELKDTELDVPAVELDRINKSDSKSKRGPKSAHYRIYPEVKELMQHWKVHPYLLAYQTPLQQLATLGYCVIPAVASPTAVEEMKDGLLQWLGLWRHINVADPTTWTSGGAMKWIPGHKQGIIQHHRAGHTRAAWQARSEPNVMRIFAGLWNCEMSDLEPSYDGINLGPVMGKKKNKTKSTPSSSPAAKKKEDEDNNHPSEPFHTDQRGTRRGVWNYQSFIALTPQGPEAGKGSLVVKSGSHLQHALFFNAKMAELTKQDDATEAGSPTEGKTKKRSAVALVTSKDWYKFTNHELTTWFPNDRFPRVDVRAEPGDMVIWDSRTLHYGRPIIHPSTPLPIIMSQSQPSSVAAPLSPRSSEIVPPYRMVIYVCMKPRSREMTPTQRRKKAKALQSLRMTSHSPLDGSLFPVETRTYSQQERDVHRECIHDYREQCANRPDLVFPTAAAIEEYLATRGATSLLISMD